jgi:hypothetical protein
MLVTFNDDSSFRHDCDDAPINSVERNDHIGRASDATRQSPTTPWWITVFAEMVMLLSSTFLYIATFLATVSYAMRGKTVPEKSHNPAEQHEHVMPTPIHESPRRCVDKTVQFNAIPRNSDTIIDGMNLSRYYRLTVRELRACLRQRQCPTTVVKEDLVRRLAISYATELSEMTTAELRRVARLHRIESVGHRAEVIRKIVEKHPGGKAGYPGYVAHRE